MMFNVILSVICILISFFSIAANAGQQNLDPIRLLRRATELSAARSDDPISSKFSTLAEIASLQAVLGDEEGSRQTTEHAVQAGGPTVIHARIRQSLRQSVLYVLVEAKIKVGDRRAAQDGLKEIAQLMEKVSSADPISALESLASMQIRVGDRAGATDAARRIVAKAENLPATSSRVGRIAGPQTKAVGLIVAARIFERSGEVELARQTRDQAEKLGASTSDRSDRLEALGHLLGARAGDGDVDGAIARLDASREFNERIDPDSAAKLLKLIAFGGAETDANAAMRAASRIQDPLQRFDALLSVARRLTYLKRWRPAMIAWVAAMGNDLTDSSKNLLGDLALAQARAGEMETARSTANRAVLEADQPAKERFYRKTFPSPYFFARIAETFWLLSDYERARSILRRAQEMTDKIVDDPIGKGVALNEVAGVLAMMGRVDEAVQTFSKSSVLDRNTLPTIVGDAASSRLKVNDLPGADRLIEFLSAKLNNSWDVGKVVERVAMLETRDGDPELSLRWAEGQKTDENKSRALFGVARGVIERKPIRP